MFLTAVTSNSGCTRQAPQRQVCKKYMGAVNGCSVRCCSDWPSSRDGP